MNYRRAAAQPTTLELRPEPRDGFTFIGAGAALVGYAAYIAITYENKAGWLGVALLMAIAAVGVAIGWSEVKRLRIRLTFVLDGADVVIRWLRGDRQLRSERLERARLRRVVADLPVPGTRAGRTKRLALALDSGVIELHSSTAGSSATWTANAKQIAEFLELDERVAVQEVASSAQASAASAAPVSSANAESTEAASLDRRDGANGS